CSSDLVVKSVLERLHKAITESGAVITCDRLPTVSGDEVQLTELFQNLIGNAIKFRGEHPLRIRLSSETMDREWQFSVRDNGIGIDPKHRDRIFVLFQRLHTQEE